MNRPCPKCPFRTDIAPFIRKARAQEIARSLRGGAEFPCHETVCYDDDDGEGYTTSKSRFCAGALIVMAKEGIAQQSQMVRIGERLGMFNLDKMDMGAPVPKSLAAWIKRHGAALCVALWMIGGTL